MGIRKARGGLEPASLDSQPVTVGVGVPPESRMNKLEGRYALWLLSRRDRGEITSYAFEAEKFRIGFNCWYTPDFRVVLPNGEIEFHETKGFWRDDALVKIRAAAHNHPYRFIGVTEKRGRWEFRNFTDPKIYRFTYNPDPLGAK